ncbi:hypothetical protein HG535_0B04710 [Zygotorulaspora mrakii]|uniref:J domain-containing protein n=1 Tax=Zygotorulaspora mrakii TaxID=42260 RepID=A0A7H9B0C5_ZYGMR|nr:uncharacterized protein HG535_0B04710 [Zygotorulaspora mrakii]QLG71429.1 hypothetical protein HG535_0B04710 [Zygotorulaspora mrakii]
MTQTLKIKLDVTTFYSSLGLTSSATDAEVQKSYRKLARELHPDKSKSDSAAELFKVINNAYSILMDREKKLRYDSTLVAKGLTEYKPRNNCHRYDGLTGGAGEDFHKDENNLKTPQKNRPSKNYNHRPYEQQPYGFGTGNEAHPTFNSHSRVPIFQSFNLKNYQRNQRSPHKSETKTEKSSSIFNNKNNGTPPHHINTEDISEKRSEPPKSEEKESSDENGTAVRSKLHKANSSDPFEHLPGSPFANNRHRHYARTKHEARTHERRSVSPVKRASNTEGADMSESWDTLKNILSNFKDEEKKLKTEKNEIELTVDSIKAAKIRKAESQSIKLDDLKDSLPIDNDLFDMRKVSDTLNTVPVIKKAKLNFKEESPEIDMNSSESKGHHHSRQNESAASKIPTNLEENLYMPVNQPLPKIYRPEIIPLHQYKITSKAIDLDLPAMPNFQCNVLNKSQMERCKQYVKEFNAKSNFLKQELLQSLSERLEADKILGDKLLKVENAGNWVSCKDFDFEVVSKLAEINSRQRIVAQSFANLLNNLYKGSPQ